MKKSNRRDSKPIDFISVSKTALENVLIFQLKHHEDHRGTYTQLYHEEDYTAAIAEHTGAGVEFLHDDIAVSMKHVLRGVHGDELTWKLITCLSGKLYFVVVNCDKESKSFGRWEKFTLTRENGKQILVPPKYGVAYVVLSSSAIFHYKQSAYYRGKTNQFTYKWDDPRFKIWWPIKNPILSERDELGRVPATS